MSISFCMQAEAVDVRHDSLAVALSTLEGNVWDGCVKLMDVNSGQELASLSCKSSISCLKFIQNSLLAGADDGNIYLYSGELALTGLAAAHHDIITGISIPDPEGNVFFSSSYDSDIYQWDVTALDEPVYRIKHAHSSSAVTSIDSIATQESGNSPHTSLVSVGGDGFLRVWDARTNPNNECAMIYNLHESLSCVHIDRSSNGRHVHIGTDSGAIHCYDLRMASSCTDENQSKNACVTFIPGAHRLRVRQIVTHALRPGFMATCSDDTTVKLWRHHSSNSSISEVSRYEVHSDYVSGLYWSVEEGNNEDIIYSASYDKTVKQISVNC